MGEHTKQVPLRTRVSIIESERGWGQKVDEIKYFDSYEEAVDFCAEFNKGNTSEHAPDWYMKAIIE